MNILPYINPSFDLLTIILFAISFLFGLINIYKGVKIILHFLAAGIFFLFVYILIFVLYYHPYILIKPFATQKQFLFSVGFIFQYFIFEIGMYIGFFIQYVIKRQVKEAIESTTTQKVLSLRSEAPILPGKQKKILQGIFFAILIVSIAVGIINAFQTDNVLIKARDRQRAYVEKLKQDDSKRFHQQIGTVFVIGGNVNSSTKGVYPESNSVEYYSPSTNVWENAPSLQEARSNSTVVATQSKIYVFGGTIMSKADSPLNSVEEFDTLKNQWSYKKQMPKGRSLASGVFIQGKIYLIGGVGSSFKKENTVLIYDPQEDDWINGPTIKDKIINNNPVCGAIGQKIYCPGMLDHSYTLVLDATTNTLKTIGSENRSKVFTGKGVVVKGKMIGLVSGTYFTVYNPLSDSYSVEYPLATYGDNRVVNFPQVFDNFGIISLDDYIIIAGGDASSGPRSEAYGLNSAYPKVWFTLPSLYAARENMGIVMLPFLYGVQKNTLGSISGFIYADKNNNHNFDQEEIPAPNIKLVLDTTRTYLALNGKKQKEVENFGNEISTTYSDSQGYYIFADVPAGKYQVKVENHNNPGEFRIVTKYLPEYKIQQTINLAKGETIENYNFNILEIPSQ